MKKYILKCGTCLQNSQDIRIEPHAWDGWNLGKKETCPACQELAIASRPAGQVRVTGNPVFSTAEHGRSL
jgi:hypothetical protein